MIAILGPHRVMAGETGHGLAGTVIDNLTANRMAELALGLVTA